MKKISIAFALSFLAFAGTALAQTNTASTTAPKPTPVIFPIAELGGCESKEACRVYCNVEANKEACFSYAQTHKLMSKEEVERAKKLRAQVGPGGCKGEECKAYCADPSHAQVCIEFAKQNGFISKEDASKRMERMNLSSTTRMMPPMPMGAMGSSSIGSTTRPKMPENRPAINPGINAGSTTKPVKPADMRPGNMGSSTKPGMPGSAMKPPMPQGMKAETNPDGTNIDYSKPPYHCTPAQAEEGACDPDQFPGYKAPPGSEQGGSVWLSILKFFGF